jgi:transposase
MTGNQIAAVTATGKNSHTLSWQHRQGGAFKVTDFHIDWEANRATCPRGKESGSWRTYQDKAGAPYIKVRFPAADCQACDTLSV